jgi:hypothetical protein
MTENRIQYGKELEVEFAVSLFDSDLEAVRKYINADKESLKLPEAVYAVLAAVVSSYFYGEVQ